MSKKKSEKGPTVEESLAKLQSKLTEFEGKSEKKSKDLDEKVQSLADKVYSMDGTSQEESEEYKEKFKQLEEKVMQFHERIQMTTTMIESIQEKMYDFETNKKNNLIFNGLPNEVRETPAKLLGTVQDIIKTKMNISRDIDISSVGRILTGPTMLGCRPVLVTFSTFKDREEVLANSKFLKVSTSIHITEDMSKKTREARQELRKFMVKVRKSNPEKKCFIQYDKLFINGRIFIYNQEEGRVLPHDGGDRVDCRSPMLSRSMSSLSRSTPNLQMDIDIEEKLAEMEKMINDQKEIISQQKLVIEEQKEKLDVFEKPENEDKFNENGEPEVANAGLMEDID